MRLTLPGLRSARGVGGVGIRLRDATGALRGRLRRGGGLLSLSDQGDELRIVSLEGLQRRRGVGGGRVAREHPRSEKVHLGHGSLRSLHKGLRLVRCSDGLARL